MLEEKIKGFIDNELFEIGRYCSGVEDTLEEIFIESLNNEDIIKIANNIRNNINEKEFSKYNDDMLYDTISNFVYSYEKVVE